jgi:hypothetical protein
MQESVQNALFSEMDNPSDEFMAIIKKRVGYEIPTWELKFVIKSLLDHFYGLNSVAFFPPDELDEEEDDKPDSNIDENADYGNETNVKFIDRDDLAEQCLHIIQDICKDVLNKDRLSLSRKKTYTSIIIDENSHKSIARVYDYLTIKKIRFPIIGRLDSYPWPSFDLNSSSGLDVIREQGGNILKIVQWRLGKISSMTTTRTIS